MEHRVVGLPIWEVLIVGYYHTLRVRDCFNDWEGAKQLFEVLQFTRVVIEDPKFVHEAR